MMNRAKSIALLIGAVALAACDFEKTQVQDITGPLPAARAKFFNFGVNAPTVNFYANDTKVTATLSGTGAELTTGVAYGGVGDGGFYSALAPGQYSFKGKISATVDKDLAVSTIPGTLADGKSYSVYMSGFYDATAKTVEGFIVEDNYPAAIDWSVAYVRFVNAISNSSPMQMFAKNTTSGVEAAVGATIAYKAGGEFVALPAGTYDLNTRTAGSSTNVITRTAVSFVAGRVYMGSSRVDLQACKLEYSIVSPK